MQAATGHITWRVDLIGDAATPQAFDARVVYHPPDLPTRPMDSGRMPTQVLAYGRALAEGAFFRQSVPFVGTLPDVPLTLVVMPHGESSPMRVSFATFDAQGAPGGHGWSEGPRTIIVHTALGTTYTSLPEEPPAPRPEEDFNA